MSKQSRKKALLTGGGFALAAAVCITGAVLWSNIGPGQSGNEDEIISEATDRDESPALSRQEVIAQKREELADKEGQFNETSIVLSDTTKERAERIANETGARLRMTKDGTYAVLYLPENVTVEDIYENDEYQEFLPDMDLDYHVRTAKVSTDPEPFTDANGNILTPTKPDYEITDPDYSMQTYLDYINLRDTWNTTRGKGVSVAVIDTGIDTDHPEFEGKISEKSYYSSEDKVVKDYGIEVIEDEQGHGTAVAGVISAGMNNDEGITGIAPEAELIVIKCDCDENGEFLRSSDLVFGLAYAIECDADVVNMSFGTDYDSASAMKKYLNLAYDSDVICVAAAGNESTSMPSYPAAFDNVVGVGALAADGYNLADYSNYGDNSDFLAPGTTYTTMMGGGYGVENGTSLACPVITGAVALYLSVNQKTEFSTLTEMLKASCVDLEVLGEDWQYGFGALDIHAFICEEKGIITYEMLTDELENKKQYFVKGHTVQYMLEPERDNLVLDGWFWDTNCSDDCEYYTNVFNDNCTLYAGWIDEDEGTAYGYTTLQDNTIEIQRYLGKRRYLTIPSEIDGKPVTSIGSCAFAFNTRLRSVILPSTLKKIGEQAFQGCGKLSSIDIPDGVEKIGSFAFDQCLSLKTIGIPSNGKLETIESRAFSMSGITEFDIPKNLSVLGSGAFYGCTSLKGISVAEENTSFVIKNNALYNYSENVLIYYPSAKSGSYEVADGTVIIGDNAFAYSRIIDISLPDSLTTINASAFQLSAIGKIVIPDNTSIIGSYAFCGSAISQVVFGQESLLTKIPAYCFSGCGNLKDITIPSEVTEISEKGFAGSGIKNISFMPGSKMEVFEKGAFICTPLTGIVIPASVTTIQNECFYGDSNLESVQFENNSQCSTISYRTFQECTALSEIELPDSVVSIGEQAFYRSGLVSVNLGSNISELGDGVFSACHSLNNISISNENLYYASYDGVLYDAGCTRLLFYPAAKAGSYTTASTTEKIGGYAFAEAYKLDGIVLNEGLTEIEKYAFLSCEKLSSIELPSTLETIGLSSFEGCKGLNQMLIPKETVSIGRFAFNGDYGLKELEIEPESKLSRIGAYTFAQCGIESFTIPRNVSSMGQSVFENCPGFVSLTIESESKLESFSADVLKNASELRQITFEDGSSLKVIEAYAYQGLSKLQSINIDNCLSLEKIGNYSFKDCSSLTGISLPDSVEEIGRYAFAGCGELASIRIPKNTAFIGRYAFCKTKDINVFFRASILPSELEENWDVDVLGYYAGTQEILSNGEWDYSLTEDGKASIIAYHGNDSDIIMDQIDGHSVISIGSGAFAGNTSLESIQLPDTLTGIYASAFKGTSGLTGISIPASVEVIDSEAFRGSGITSVNFADGSRLVSLGQYAFAETKQLNNISLPKDVEKIKSYSFYKSGIRGIRFDENAKLTEIGRYAFAESSLEDITIPSLVERIDYYAFSETGNLTTFDFGNNSAMMVMGHAFYKCGLNSVRITKGITYLGEQCFTSCDKLVSISVDDENTNYSSNNGVLFDKLQKKLITCPAGKTGNYDVADTVTTFALSAFEGCKLDEIHMSEDSQLITIGYRTFMNCDNLQEISIPSSVQGIGNYAFAYCDNLTTVSIGADSIMAGIYKGAFYSDKKLSNIIIPDSVQEISEYAFYGCEKMMQATISDSCALKGIFDYAFAYSGITSINMSNELVEIGNYAFKGAKLSVIGINDKVQTIGQYAFADCGLADMKEIVFPDSLEYIGSGTLQGVEEVEKLVLPFLGEYAGDENGQLRRLFALSDVEGDWTHLKNLKQIVIKKGDAVPREAFKWLPYIQKVELPKECQIIGSSAFRSCEHLNSIVLPEQLLKIEDKAFEQTVSLENVAFPEGLVYIGKQAFSGSKLTSLSFPESLVHIGEKAFESNNMEELSIGKNVEVIGSGAFSGCESLSAINVSVDNQYYSSVDGLLYSKDGKNLLSVPAAITGDIELSDGLERIDNGAFKYCKKLTGVKIPDSVTYIGDEAFFRCDTLKKAVIPASVEYLGEGAFQYCFDLEYAKIGCKDISNASNLFEMCSSLEVVVFNDEITEIPMSCFETCGFSDIALPANLNKIGRRAFCTCTSLKGISIPKGVITIGDASFSGCGSLESIDVDEENEYYTGVDGILYDAGCTTMICVPAAIKGSVTIPDGVETLGEAAFNNCQNLEEVIIPDSVKNIGNNCFSGCTNLNNIEIGGGVDFIDYAAFIDCGYYLDEDNWIDGALYIGEYLIAVKQDITELEIREGTRLVASLVGPYAQIKTLKFPDSLKIINTSSFMYCSDLSVIRMGSGLEKIDGSVFEQSRIEAIRFPETISSSFMGKNTNLRYVKFGKNERVFDNKSIPLSCLGGSVKVLEVPGLEHNIFNQDMDIEKLVISTDDKMSTDYLVGLSEETTVFCYAQKDQWPYGWENGHKTYYKDEWHLISFYVDGALVTMDALVNSEVVQLPSESELSKYISKNNSIIGWDINGDGKADTIPVNLTSDIEAVAVIDKPITEIKLSETEKTLETGAYCQLSVTYLPKDNNDTEEVIWSVSGNSVASVDENGRVTALSEGSAIVTAVLKDNDAVKATCTLTVTKAQAGIKLDDGTEGTVNVGETLTMNPRVVLAEGEPEGSFTYSVSDNTIVTVEDGQITGVAPGKRDISISYNEYKANYTVTVLSPLQEIEVVGPEEMNVKGKETFNVKRTPANTTDQTAVSWSSSDYTIATVDSKGRVTALKPGTVTITAKVGSITDSKEVTIYAPIEKIWLNTTTGTLRLDKTKQLNVIFEPQNTTDDKKTVWSSEDPTIATVSENGIVTGISTGKTVIHGTVGSHDATYTVSVIGIRDQATGITVTNSDDTEMEEGTSLTVEQLEDEEIDELYAEDLDKFEVEMLDGSGRRPMFYVYNINVWVHQIKHQLEKMVDVEMPVPPKMHNGRCKVYRLEPDGTYTEMDAIYKDGKIFFKTNHFSIYCLGMVTEEIYAETVTIDQGDQEMRIDTEKTLTATVLPAGLTNYELIWSSDDASVATVSGNGLVCAVGIGETKIRATAKDENGQVSGECKLTVKDHAWDSDYTIDVAPTCTEAGSKSIHCSDCDATKDSTVIPAPGHEWEEEFTVDKAVTCTEDGSKSIHCKNCDAVKDSTVIQTEGHQYGEWETVTSPSCTDKGSKKHECTVCHYVETQDVDPNGHEWEEEFTVDKAATCTEDGSKSIHCKNCDTVKDSTVIPAGHEWEEEYRVDKAVTCTEDGSKSIHCKNCDAVKDITVIRTEGHKYGEWETVTSPSCADKGSKKHECTICHYVETQDVDPNGHEWEEEFTVDKAATCTEDGSKSIHCKNCDAVKDSTVIPTEGHKYGEWETVTSPSCTDKGSKKHECTACHYVETQDVDPNGHEWEEGYTVDKAATCTEDGSKSIHCKNCDAVKDSAVIPAPGHEWESDYTIDKKATETEKGSKSIHCKNCDAKKDVTEIPMITKSDDPSQQGGQTDPSGQNTDTTKPGSQGAGQPQQGGQTQPGGQTQNPDTPKQSDQKTEVLKEGDEQSDETTQAVYEVVSTKTGKEEVAYSESTNDTSGNVVIPDQVTLSDGHTYKVTSIESGAFEGDTSLKKVTIGKNVVIIDENAFAGCTNLTTVTIKGNTLKTIKSGAFDGCKRMKKLTLGKNVKRIEKNAFRNCKGLKTLIFKMKNAKKVKFVKGAFKGLNPKCKIKVVKSQYAKFKAALKKAGLSSKVKVVKS